MKIGKVTRYDEPRPVHLAVKIPRSNLPVVFIQKEALWEMYSHAAGEMHHEVGGYLLGFPLKDIETGTEATYIEKAVRAIYDSTPTHVTMLPESFREVELVREQSDTILVGYYHSHPRLGIFQSGTDVKNFMDYHPESYQIAVVVDPSRTTPKHLDVRPEWIGFFGWEQHSTPVELPVEHVSVVENRPEANLEKV